MNKCLILLICLTLIFAEDTIVRRPAIVMVGDSITEQALTTEGGSFRKIADTYVSKLDVINRGLSGYNTRGALKAVKLFIENEDTFDPKQKTLVIIMLGSNDSVFKGYEQYVSLDDYRTNLISIIELIKAHGEDYKFLLLPPVPVCDKQFNKIWKEHSRNNENTRKYYFIAKEVADSFKGKEVYFVDTWENELKEWNQKDYSMHTDGLHLTAKAYDVLDKYIMKTINENIKEYIPDNLPGYPSWNDFNKDEIKFLF